VSSALVGIGAALGIVIPGIGIAIGALAGAGAAGIGNKRLKPHVLILGMIVMGVSQDDLFYYRHKSRVDQLANSFAGTYAPR
jgi:predicted exporter